MIDIIFNNWYSLIGEDFFILIFALLIIISFMYAIIRNWL